MNITNIWFSFKGRINRAKYWLVTVTNWLVGVALFMIAVASQSWALGILTSLLFVPILISSTAAAVKRLHDREKSAWWLLVFYLLPAALEALGNAWGDAGIALLVASVAISVWALVELGCLRGTAGENPYGPDPLEGRG